MLRLPQLLPAMLWRWVRTLLPWLRSLPLVEGPWVLSVCRT